MRLQRYLASCGLGSRRACEQLIADGLIAVDGQAVSEQGVTIDPVAQQVTCRGRLVRPQSYCYLILNKPAGILCTSHDPEGRDTFLSLLPPDLPRVFSVGRLDQYSEGLLLVTNDGDLANQLAHPRYGARKTYHAWVERALTTDEIQRMQRGIRDEGEWLRVVSMQLVRESREGFQYVMVLSEGRNRHIRRMFEALQIRVKRLRRVSYGPLRLEQLQPGAYRSLTLDEVAGLKKPKRDGA